MDYLDADKALILLTKAYTDFLVKGKNMKTDEVFCALGFLENIDECKQDVAVFKQGLNLRGDLIVIPNCLRALTVAVKMKGLYGQIKG